MVGRKCVDFNVPEIKIVPYTIQEALRKSVILPPIPEPPPAPSDVNVCKCHKPWKPKLKKKKRVIPADVLESRRLEQYMKMYPFKIYPSDPCHFFPRKLDQFLKEIHQNPELGLERIIQIEEKNCLYLKYALLAKTIGAWDAVKGCCAFCSCEYLCRCTSKSYTPRDPYRELNRSDDWYKFKQRVKHTYQPMYILYNQLEDPWPRERYYEIHCTNETST